MNELMIFNDPEFGEIRTVEINSNPWLVGKDVAAALGYSNTKDALARHVDNEDKRGSRIPTPSGAQEMTIINESGLYTVILRSDKPEAKPFRKWVTSKVLPAIRKTGSYSANALPDSKAALAEAKAKNARARVASIWLKLAKENPIPEYRQICAHYASAELTGGQAVFPLPEAAERTYSAAEVGELLGGISANMIGRMANQNGMKTKEYAIQVWDKSPHSAKQVPAWRYNEKAVSRFRELLQ